MSQPIKWDVGEELKELDKSKVLYKGWLRNNCGKSQKFTDLIQALMLTDHMILFKSPAH